MLVSLKTLATLDRREISSNAGRNTDSTLLALGGSILLMLAPPSPLKTDLTRGKRGRGGEKCRTHLKVDADTHIVADVRRRCSFLRPVAGLSRQGVSYIRHPLWLGMPIRAVTSIVVLQFIML